MKIIAGGKEFEYPIPGLSFVARDPYEPIEDYNERMKLAIGTGREFIALGGLDVVQKMDSMSYSKEEALDFLNGLEETLGLRPQIQESSFVPQTQGDGSQLMVPRKDGLTLKERINVLNDELNKTS